MNWMKRKTWNCCKLGFIALLPLSLSQPTLARVDDTGSVVLSIITKADFGDLTLSDAISRLAPVATFRRVEDGDVSSVVFVAGNLPDVQDGLVLLYRPRGSDRDHYSLGLLVIQISAEHPSVAVARLVQRMIAFRGRPAVFGASPFMFRQWRVSRLSKVIIGTSTDEAHQHAYAIEFVHLPAGMVKSR